MRVGIRATRIIKTKAFDNVASNVYSKCICSCVCSLPWRESAHEGFTSSYEGGKWRVGRNTEEVGGEGGARYWISETLPMTYVRARTHTHVHMCAHFLTCQTMCSHARALQELHC